MLLRITSKISYEYLFGWIDKFLAPVGIMAEQKMGLLLEELSKFPPDSYSTKLARDIVQICEEAQIHETIEEIFQNEGEYFFRYVIPWLPGKEVVNELIKLLGKMTIDNHPHIGSIASHLIDCDITDFEEEFTFQIKRIINLGDWNLTSKVIQSCERFISEDLGIFLLDKFNGEEDDLIAPIIHNSSTENILSNLKKMAESDLFVLSDSISKPLLIRFPESDLSDVFEFLIDADMLGYSPWSTLQSTISAYGSYDHISLLDLIPSDIQKRDKIRISNIKSVLKSRKESILNSESVPAKSFQNWIRYVIKDRKGFSETKLRGFYMGLKEGPHPSSIRQSILTEILKKPLQNVHHSRSPEDFPRGRNRWFNAMSSTGQLLGDWKYSDFKKRIDSAEQFITKNPHSPWGFYAFEILNHDRWELLRKFGISVGFLPYLEYSSLGLGLVDCKILDMNHVRNHDTIGGIQCCENLKIGFSKSALFCQSCEVQFANFDLSWENAKRNIRGDDLENASLGSITNATMIVDPDGEVVVSTNNEKITKLTKRKYQNHRQKVRQFMPYLPPRVWDHLAAMHADVEEMYGVSGDAMSRWGLE